MGDLGVFKIELSNPRSNDLIHYAFDLLKGRSDLLGQINFDISNISISIMFKETSPSFFLCLTCVMKHFGTKCM
jgi:hypothetical protein